MVLGGNRSCYLLFLKFFSPSPLRAAGPVPGCQQGEEYFIPFYRVFVGMRIEKELICYSNFPLQCSYIAITCYYYLSFYQCSACNNILIALLAILFLVSSDQGYAERCF